MIYSPAQSLRQLSRHTINRIIIQTLSLLMLLLIFSTRASAENPTIAYNADTKSATLQPGEWSYYNVIIPANAEGFKVTLNHTGTGDPDLYLQLNIDPTLTSSFKKSTDAESDTLLITNVTSADRIYHIGIHLPVSDTDPTNFTLESHGEFYESVLTWDDGNTLAGTSALNLTSAEGGLYYYKITTQAPTLDVWRAALTVSSGEADLHAKTGNTPPTTTSSTVSSTNVGDDGFTRQLSHTTGGGEKWYLLIDATAGTTCKLVVGNIFAQDLGDLAASDSTNSSVTTEENFPPEGARFYKTSIPSDALAWRLWLKNGLGKETWNHDFYIRKGLAPYTSTQHHDQQKMAQGLLVPTYIEPGDGAFYYVGIWGEPNDTFTLDSRQQVVTDIDFDSSATGHTETTVTSTDDFRFKTFRVTVPQEQIAWDLSIQPTSGDPNLSLRRDNIPNPLNNDAFSEVVSTSTTDSISLTPPFLSDGIFYITTYSDDNYTGTLKNIPPEVTPIDYATASLDPNNPAHHFFSISNDIPNQDRAGWRYFAVTDNGEPQLSSLGWLLTLENQVPDTKIAIRRNYVPSGRKYRENGSTTIKFENSDDDSSLFGSLQHRNHESDIWYIGIYTPEEALGAFTLKSGHEYADIIPMNHGSESINLPANAWTFYRIDVPATIQDAQSTDQDVLGWDLQVSSWTGLERPQMVIRRNALPADTKSLPTSIKSSTEWLGGSQWASYDEDWTHRPFSADGLQENESFGLSIAMGQPLETGTYYVGFYNPSQADALNLTFTSKAIGEGMLIEPQPLGFKTGDPISNIATITDLPARQISYFYVDVPENTPSWRISLTADVGECSLYLREGWIPTSEAASKDGASDSAPYDSDYRDTTKKTTNLVRLQKEGDEHYTLKPKKPYTLATDPPMPGTHIPAGRYYLMVVSEGVIPIGEYNSKPDHIGVGNSSAILTSHGSPTALDLGTMTTGQSISHPDTYTVGALKQYTFTVGVDVKALEVTLTDRVGNPHIYALHLAGDEGFPNGGKYGYYSGRLLTTAPYKTNGGSSPTLATLNNTVASSTWKLVIMDAAEADSIAEGSFTLNVKAVGESPLTFNSNQTITVTDQVPETWSFYKVIVPATIQDTEGTDQDVLGWEIKLHSWTGNGESPEHPEMVICRDSLPMLPLSRPNAPNTNLKQTEVAWSSGAQWMSYDEDWTHRPDNFDGTIKDESLGLSIAMGQPLEPGTYYVGFYNPSETDTCSFTFTSKGIGEGMEISPQPLGFQSGDAIPNQTTITDLPARQVQYFYVDIPEDTPSWRISLAATTGESSLYLRQSWLPTSDVVSKDGTANAPPYAWEDDPLEPETGNLVRLQKQGDEHYTLLPKEGGLILPTGRYYLMVVSEGVVDAEQTTTNSKWIGTGSSTSTLTSHGIVSTIDLGIVPDEGEVTSSIYSYQAGRVNHHTFNIPAGVKSLEIYLENRVGDPWMYGFYMDTPPLIFSDGGAYGYHSGYKLNDYGGKKSNHLLTLTNPAPNSSITLVVMDPSTDTDSSTPLASGSYTIRIKTVGEKQLTFDNGQESITDQSPGTWSFFKVEVPETINSEAVLGWELKLTEWTGGLRPKMYVSRDTLPSDNTSTSGLKNALEWPSGEHWKSYDKDWTQRIYSADGVTRYESFGLTFAMGQPLEPGTYYVGFYNEDDESCSFTVTSKGIGEGMQHSPQPLAFTGGTATITELPARQVRYFYVDVPADTPSWRINLTTNSGESALYLRQSWVPTSEAAGSDGSAIIYPYDSDYRETLKTTSLVKLNKSGDEHYTLLPKREDTTTSGSGIYLPEGRYYLMVVSEGQDPQRSTWIGTGHSSSTLTSVGEAPIHNLGSLPLGGQLVLAESYEQGELDLIEFNIPENTAAFEVKIMDRIGNPLGYFEWINTTNENRVRFPKAGSYGYFSSETADIKDFTRTTLANPSPGTYRLSILDSRTTSSFAAGAYTLVITSIEPLPLNFSELENGNGESHQASGSLADDERAYYQVDMPSILANNPTGAPIIGWRIEIASTSGQPELRVNSELLPEGTSTAQSTGLSLTRWAPHSVIIAPAELTSGTWYIEVKGVGAASEYVITSSPITLEREMWLMPRPEESSPTPGLTAPDFADTGIDDSGNPLTGDDQGVDLENGHYHYYAIEIPEGNGGLLRAQLDAISGDPDLYIRYGDIPTIDHFSPASGSSARALYNFQLNADAETEYGNFVPADGRIESELKPGIWYLAVRASSETNARYRLKLSRGTVTPLEIDGGSATDQILASGDFHYYRVTMPQDADRNWNITYSVSRGDVDLFIRDTIPAGNYLTLGSSGRVTVPSTPADWYSKDKKNSIIPKSADIATPGTYTFTHPAIRPGSTYYIGFRANADATFTMESSLETDVAIGTITELAFKDGAAIVDIPTGETYYYKVNVPDTALKWVSSITRTKNIEMRIEQGSLPSFDGTAHKIITTTSASPTTSKLTLNLSTWPWVPSQTYYIGFKNTGDVDEGVTFTMAGETALTYAEWATSEGLPVDPAEANQDNNNNGIIDLLEYALTPIGAYPSIIMSEIIRNDDDSLALIFKRPDEARSGKTILVQSSHDLINWDTIASKLGMGGWEGEASLKETDLGSTIQVKVEYPSSFANKGFLRVKVNLE